MTFTITLPLRIYKQHCIEKAMIDYNHIAEFATIQADEEACVLTLTPRTAACDECLATRRNFLKYVLDMSLEYHLRCLEHNGV